jgi:addiction module RelE/StbE family toxin
MSSALRWTRRALNRLEHIGAYINSHNPAAAGAVVNRIVSATEALREMPEQARRGRVKGTRELVFPDLPYIVVYRLNEDAIEILTVIHTSQRWPTKL